MHFTMNIQSILSAGFMILMAAPLPIIILSSPLGFIWEKIMHWRYYKIVKKHFERPELVSFTQLQRIFPNKVSKELNRIAYYLQEESSYKDN